MTGRTRYSAMDEAMLRAMGIRPEPDPSPEPAQQRPIATRPIEPEGEAGLHWRIGNRLIHLLNEERARRAELEGAVERCQRIMRGWMAVALCAGAGMIAALVLCWLQRAAYGRP